MKKEAREYFDDKIRGFDDAEVRLFARVVPVDKSKMRHIHIAGICGTAMGSLAVLLKKAGYEVSGSDEHCYPPMSNVIDELGIVFKEGFSGEHLAGADVVIIGNVCGPSNAEAQHARENGIPTLSLPEAVELFFIKDKKSIVVAGTHGKTTTTGLLSHVFKSAGLRPGYMVGGVMQGGEESSAIGSGDYFIIEGDEYDTAYFDKAPKFLHYAPYLAIITSLEFDHVDIYKDMQAYTETFQFLVKEVPADGGLFICGDRIEVKALASFAEAPVSFYGLEEGNSITARNVISDEDGQYFSLVISGAEKGQFFVPLSGNHNLLNALAVCGVALRSGISLEQLKEGLRSFKGMKRRQEIVFDQKGITILDDFAHHPTAVIETINAIKMKYPDRRLVVFFEPRSATSRRKFFEEDYGKSFDKADLVFISTPELHINDDAEHFIDPSRIIEAIKEKGIPAQCFKTPDELLEKAFSSIKVGDVILIMSNGSFDGIHMKLAERLLKV